MHIDPRHHGQLPFPQLFLYSLFPFLPFARITENGTSFITFFAQQDRKIRDP
jgi:hypothetical protein